MKGSFLSKLDSNVRKLSKGHKKIASYIKENYDKAAFMTASALGRKVGVSESTVVRFATELGFKGNPELQKELSGTSKRASADDKIKADRSSKNGGFGKPYR